MGTAQLGRGQLAMIPTAGGPPEQEGRQEWEQEAKVGQTKAK